MRAGGGLGPIPHSPALDASRSLLYSHVTRRHIVPGFPPPHRQPALPPSHARPGCSILAPALAPLLMYEEVLCIRMRAKTD